MDFDFTQKYDAPTLTIDDINRIYKQAMEMKPQPWVYGSIEQATRLLLRGVITLNDVGRIDENGKFVSLAEDLKKNNETQ